MPLDDAIDWNVMGPKYRARLIRLDAALQQIISLSRSTPRRVLAPGAEPNPTSVALTKAEEIASAALSG